MPSGARRMRRPVPPRSSPERRQARYSGVKVAQSGRAVGEFLHGTGGIAARQARRRQRAEATQSGPVPKRRVPQECGSCSSGQVRCVEGGQRIPTLDRSLAAASRKHYGKQRQLHWSRPAPGAQVKIWQH
uniref:cDNA sequence BC030500 n=1 Tax=Peromyscus maniculatus bairdii TaxID=230844 RepID=A0A8C8TMB1_PERMB